MNDGEMKERLGGWWGEKEVGGRTPGVLCQASVRPEKKGEKMQKWPLGTRRPPVHPANMSEYSIDAGVYSVKGAGSKSSNGSMLSPLSHPPFWQAPQTGQLYQLHEGHRGSPRRPTNSTAHHQQWLK